MYLNNTTEDHTVKVNQGLLIFKGVGIGTLMVVNWFVNTLCLVVLHRIREMNPVTKIFMFSITITDLSTGLYGVFILTAVAKNSWPFGETLCRITGVCNSTLIAGGMFSLLAVNADRYIAVTRPFHYHTLVTTRRAYIALAVLWSVAVLSGLLSHLLPGRKSVYNPVLHSCVSDPIDPDVSDIIGTAWNGIFFVLPILATLLMFLRLYLIAKDHANRIAKQTPGGGRKTPNLKGATTFFLMTLAILSLSLPTISGFVYENLTRKQVPIAFTYVCVLLVFSYSIVNVAIYFTRNTAFKRTAQGIVSNIFTKRVDFSSDSNVSGCSSTTKNTSVAVIS